MSKWKEPKTDCTVGSPVTAQIFNDLAENEMYLNETKITTHNVQEAIIASEQNSVRQNLADQDTIMGAFGKIRKWFADLKSLAFKDKVENADIVDVTADKVKGLHSVSRSGNYNELINKPLITKATIGLDKVVNERQYSENNTPPYPVTSVNGQMGEVVLEMPVISGPKQELLWSGNVASTTTKFVNITELGNIMDFSYSSNRGTMLMVVTSWGNYYLTNLQKNLQSFGTVGVYPTIRTNGNFCDYPNFRLEGSQNMLQCQGIKTYTLGGTTISNVNSLNIYAIYKISY